jgi:hypothetical protein
MAAIDQMDRGLSLINVALMALNSDDSRDPEMIEHIKHTIEQGLSALAPVREFVDHHGSVDQAAAAVRDLGEAYDPSTAAYFTGSTTDTAELVRDMTRAARDETAAPIADRRPRRRAA